MKCAVIVKIIILMTVFLRKNKANFHLSTFPNTAVEGEDFSFICLYGTSFVEFRRDGQAVCVIIGINADNSCNTPGKPDEKYTYSCNSTIYTLTIPGQFMTENLHDSTWECLNVLNSSQRSDRRTLFINVPITTVTLLSTPVDENPVTVIIGKNKQFSCKTDAGRPSSNIQWYLSNVNITSAAESQYDECSTDCSDGIEITSSQLIYKGNIDDTCKFIYCTAINIEGHRVRSTNKIIDVLHSPFTPSISQEPPAPVNENTSIILTCEIKGGNPLAVIIWQCNGSTSGVLTSNPVRNDTTISKLQLTATRESNGKICTCIGSHPAWTQTNFTRLILNIRYAPAQPSIIQSPSGPVNEGNKVILTCEIFGGNPLATITWTCNGSTDIRSTPSPYTDKVVSSIELIITRENDGNECICKGNHPLWSNGRSGRHLLIVYYSPTTLPAMTQTPPGSVDYGTKIKLTCEVIGGKPSASITWQCKKSTPAVVQATPSRDRSISSVQLTVEKEQNGQVCVCFCSHPTWVHNKSDTKQLDVKYPPELFLPISQTPIGPVIADDMVSFTCEIYGGNPVANISWTCDWFKPLTSTVNILNDKVVSRIEKRVTRDDNGKNCTCMGLHRLWNPVTQEKSHTINIFYSSTIQIMNAQPILLVEHTSTVLVCTEVDGNPRNATFMWYKFNTVIGDQANYPIRIVNANDAGNYSCHGSNGFGIESKENIEVHVLYSPRVSALSALNGSTIEEDGTAVLQCTIQSNPPPNIVWMKHGINAIMISKRTVFQSNVTIIKAHCLDTSNYTCKAMNTINNVEYTTMKDIELFVTCSPRRYDGHDGSTHLIALTIGQNLTISEHILAYPMVIASWLFKQDEHSRETTVFSDSNCSVYTIANHHICFSRPNLTEQDFGFYSVVIANDKGKMKFSHKVIPQGPPDAPTDILVACEITSMIVSWQPGFNGGIKQTFRVAWLNIKTQHTEYSFSIVDSSQKLTKQYIIKSLVPDTAYTIYVEAANRYGIVRSTDNDNCTTRSSLYNSQPNTNMAMSVGAGIGSSVFILLVAVLVVLVLKKRIKYKEENNKLYQSTHAGVCACSRKQSDIDKHNYSELQTIRMDSNPGAMQTTSSNSYEEIGKQNDEPNYQNESSRNHIISTVYANMEI